MFFPNLNPARRRRYDVGRNPLLSWGTQFLPFFIHAERHRTCLPAGPCGYMLALETVRQAVGVRSLPLISPGIQPAIALGV